LKNGNVPFFNNKVVFNQDRFQIGYAAKLNLLAYTVARYNLFLSYNERDFTLLAEHTSRNQTKVEMGKLLLGAIYRRGGNDYVVKASYRPHKADQLRVKLGTVVALNTDTILRAKINNNTK